MRIVVFYSYKGGTGRTLALANVARFATRAGKKVVVLDMDLEAPGLTYKLLPREHQRTRCRGLVGCLLETLQRGEVPQDLGEFILDIEPRDFPHLAKVQGGWLRLMPAGAVPSPNYFGDLRRLALDARVDSGEAAELLHKLLAKIEQDLEPDLILIDARTGITNSNTLVLSELADAVFAFFLDLPEQLDGVRMVLRSLVPLQEDATRPLAIHGVVSRTPVDQGHFANRGIKSAQDRSREARIARFMTEPGVPERFTLAQLPIFHLHNEVGLLAREALLMEAFEDPAFASSTLAFDYFQLAAAVIQDKDAMERLVAPLLEGRDPRRLAVASLLLDDPSLMVPPLLARLRSDGPDAVPREPLLSTIDRLRAVPAPRDPVVDVQLVEALNTLAADYRRIGRQDDAVAAGEESVEISRHLVGVDTAFVPPLASALNNLGILELEAGRADRASAHTEEAVQCWRRHLSMTGVAAPDPLVLRDLAHSLENLGNQYIAQGRRADAVGPTVEAVEVLRRLAATHRQARRELAQALCHLGALQDDLGQPKQAAIALEEAMGYLRELDVSDRTVRRTLAGGLNDLALVYSQLDRPAEAQTLAEQSVVMWRGLAGDDFGAVQGLASALTNLGARYALRDRFEEALAAIEEAVLIRRRAAALNPSIASDLATSLQNLAVVSFQVGRDSDALAAIEEAVQTFRSLAAHNPGMVAPLAQSLRALARSYEAFGRADEAARAQEEADRLGSSTSE